MLNAFPETDPYAELEKELGHPPKYFQKLDTSGRDDLFPAVLVAFQLEITRSVRLVANACGGMTFSGVRKECLTVGFKFDQMIADDVLSGLSHRELKQRHMVGGARIAKIEQEHGKARRPGVNRGKVVSESDQRFREADGSSICCAEGLKVSTY